MARLKLHWIKNLGNIALKSIICQIKAVFVSNWHRIWILNKLNSFFTCSSCPDRSVTTGFNIHLIKQWIQHWAISIWKSFFAVKVNMSDLFFEMTHQKLIICGWLTEGSKNGSKMMTHYQKTLPRTKATYKPFWEKTLFWMLKIISELFQTKNRNEKWYIEIVFKCWFWSLYYFTFIRIFNSNLPKK